MCDSALRSSGRCRRCCGGHEGHRRPRRALTGSASVVLLALALDIAVGDPPNRVHPVSWIGTLLAIGQRHLARGSWLRLRTAGAVLVVTVAFVAGAAGGVIADVTASRGLRGRVLGAIAVELTFAGR